MPSREQLVEQLRKLETLARRAAGTPEGVAARRKLQELMERHGIATGELRPREVKKAPIKSAPKAAPSATLTLKIGDVRIRWKL